MQGVIKFCVLQQRVNKIQENFEIPARPTAEVAVRRVYET